MRKGRRKEGDAGDKCEEERRGWGREEGVLRFLRLLGEKVVVRGKKEG